MLDAECPSIWKQELGAPRAKAVSRMQVRPAWSQASLPELLETESTAQELQQCCGRHPWASCHCAHGDLASLPVWVAHSVQGATASGSLGPASQSVIGTRWPLALRPAQCGPGVGTLSYVNEGYLHCFLLDFLKVIAFVTGPCQVKQKTGEPGPQPSEELARAAASCPPAPGALTS